jgi:DNA invertase Pin-like site-specific DNA recombinase
VTISALLYARISITDKHVPKVANQLADLRRLATSRGYAIAGEYVDDGLSAARAENRPDFDRLMRDLPEHRGAVLLATEESRFARNEIEKAGLMLACANASVTWETVRDGTVDPATASGALMATLRGGIDAFESRRKAERQKAANLHRRENGLHYTNGPAPFGWNEDRITLNEPQAELIRSGSVALLAGGSLHSITKDWRASGIAPPRARAWTRVSVLMTLKRWRNAAVVAYQDQPLRDDSAPGNLKPYKIGQWEPILTVADVEAARAIILAKTGTKRIASRLCSGVARCACGEYMIATGANGARAYMCSARIRGLAKPGTVHAGIKAELLEAKVRDELITSYFIAPSSSGPAEDEAKTLASLYERRAAAESAMARLLDQVEAGTLKEREIASRVTKRREAIDQLDGDIARLSAESAHASLLNSIMAEILLAADVVGGKEGKAVRDALEHSDPTQRRHLTNAIVMSWWRMPEFLGEGNEKRLAMQTALGEQFDALPLDQQRHLVRSLLTITVSPGRGIDRVATTPQ